MRLQNRSRYPTDEVRQLIEFGMRGVNTTGVAVHVKNTPGDGYGGMAYQGVPCGTPAALLSTVDYLVTLRIAAPDGFPYDNSFHGWKRAPLIVSADWREGLVVVAAHEARHIHQYRHGKPHSQVDAERFAAKAVARYREYVRRAA